MGSTGKSDGNGQRSPGGGVHGDEAGGEQRISQPGTQASTASDDGSSPLVPILIAIAVLAAISIGTLVMRQRRGSGGDSISPEAN